MCRLKIMSLEKNIQTADTSLSWKTEPDIGRLLHPKGIKIWRWQGLLPRLRMKINKNLIKFVGKETANLDVANVVGVTGEDSYTVYDNLRDKILGISPRTHKFGISGSLIFIQKKIGENGVLRLQKSILEKLKRPFSGMVSENFRNEYQIDK